MTISPEKIVEIASYFTVISHTKGRLRVRVNPKIKEEVSGVSIEDIQTLSQKINGVNHIKINKMIGSVTITYAHDIFPKEIWDNAIKGQNTDEVIEIINKLKKEVA